VGALSDLAAQLDRVRLESDTLYDLIGVVASSPDLDRVLEGVVDLLTRATACHACFVYLRVDDRLRLRAASSVYAHLVGAIEFGVDQGLAGWAVRRNELGFIRENALADERVVYVPELEEERFQSMVAVPIPTRGGRPMGAIVLHTIAPREFDEATRNLLAHAAPLVAGPIENARLLEDARRRVEALTALSRVSQRIAAVAGRHDLYRAACEGLRSLLGCDEARLYELEGDRRRLQLVAADPALETDASAADATGVLIELAQRRGARDPAARRRLREALAMEPGAGHVLAAPVAAGDEHLGVLVAAGAPLEGADADDLLQAVANQVAVALKKAELIERLTEENLVRDLLSALESGRLDDAAARARQVRCDLDRPHLYAQLVRAREQRPQAAWPQRAERAEGALRRLVPGALCDVGDGCVRALLPLATGASAGELERIDTGLGRLGVSEGLAIGRSAVHQGAHEARAGLREADDAARVVAALEPQGGLLAHAELGAYRYLVPRPDAELPNDPYLDAVRTIEDYDRRRGSELVPTLERYLSDRRGVTETARALTVHPNTLRQRLDRIEKLTGIELATADLLALELALRVARMHRNH
jgi:GAF domain-containing protein